MRSYKHRESLKHINRAYESRKLGRIGRLMAWIEGDVEVSNRQVYLGYVMTVVLMFWLVWEASA